jgi:hypothetical protein
MNSEYCLLVKRSQYLKIKCEQKDACRIARGIRNNPSDFFGDVGYEVEITMLDDLQRP